MKDACWTWSRRSLETPGSVVFCPLLPSGGSPQRHNKHPGLPWVTKYSPKVRETFKPAHLSHQGPSSLNDKIHPPPKASGLLFPAACCIITRRLGIMNHGPQRKTPKIHPQVEEVRVTKDWLLSMSPRAGIPQMTE